MNTELENIQQQVSALQENTDLITQDIVRIMPTIVSLLSENEKKMQKLWEEKEAYKFKGVDERPVYSVDTPPPTVSGKLHVGHIFSFTQSEMLVRYHRLKGDNIYYPFGFDDNGLPTERLVEREEGIFAKDLPRSEFIEKCTITKDKYIKEFQNLFKRLGISADWDLGYDTINELSRKVSQRSFIDLVKKGKAYRKEMPVFTLFKNLKIKM